MNVKMKFLPSIEVFKMNDAVFLGSIVAVSICIVIFALISVYALKKINNDHSED
jgi:hypothetical protein